MLALRVGLLRPQRSLLSLSASAVRHVAGLSHGQQLLVRSSLASPLPSAVVSSAVPLSAPASASSLAPSTSSSLCAPIGLAALSKLAMVDESSLARESFELTSVRRKRLLKMSKHKLKKRRRKMKALLKRLGKI